MAAAKLAAFKAKRKGPTYVVEHMEEGLEDWCRLEYRHICRQLPPERVLFLNWPAGTDPADLVPHGAQPPGTSAESLETVRAKTEADAPDKSVPFPKWDRICLLDMDAEDALEPDDCSKFDAVVFGGILGNITHNEDGTYGSDDRTAEVRKLGFTHRRHLGPMQMTTDTAIVVSRMVLEEARSLSEIPWLDSPEIGGGPAADGEGEEGGGASDCVCMEGFRYVATRGAGGGDWEPLLPEGMKELLMSDADKNLLDEFE
mmetsp:Transcript_20796/g.55101  ORF Transcript_20796/g.55101 Transcript_20796/m.55101 type:complete len:258 (-) Transcript_20796:76-849(-)